MRLRNLAFLIVALIQLCALAAAQTQPTDSDADKEKKKKELDERVVKMLDQAAGDASVMRLPQNRAVVLAISADLYWKFDEKRARELFGNSADEIRTFNQECEKEVRENKDNLSNFYDSCGDVRHEVLPLIAKHDAELALDLLLQTRPVKLAEIIARSSLPNNKPVSDPFNYNPERYVVASEIELEQKFALLAADENPNKAIKLIKDSLAKGISDNVLPLLQKLSKKDEKKAADLAGDVIKKLVDTDLSKSNDDMNVAIRFMQFAFKPQPTANAKEKQFAFSESQVKVLANKLANTFFQPSKSMVMFGSLERAMPMLEKFVPDRIVLLKQRQAEMISMLPSEFANREESSRVYNPNSTPEDILALIPKQPNEYEKADMYERLAARIGEIEDETRAKKLIEQIPDEKARASAQEAFEAARIGRTAEAGKLDEARKLIANLTKKKIQIQRLVALAQQFQKKGGETDVAVAKSLMKDAKALTKENPESIDDIDDVMEVVKVYTLVDPDSGFRMFEPVVDQLNDYVQASSVLARFEAPSSFFKKGELVLRVNGRNWDLLMFKYIPQMQLLGKADLERMNSLADHFARPESRLIVRLYVLQGFLKDDKKQED